MKRLIGIGSTVVLLGSLLMLLGALFVDRLLSTEVLFISPKPADVVRMDRELWEPGQSVAEIYGVPASQLSRVVLPDSARLIRPREDPSLVLMQVDKGRGQNPLQVKTVWFVAVRAALGGVLLALIGLILNLALSRRRRSSSDAAGSLPWPGQG